MENTITLPYLVSLTSESLIKIACIKKIIVHPRYYDYPNKPDWDKFVNMYDLPVDNLLRVSINLDVIDQLECSMKEHLY